MIKVECPGCKAPYQVDERRVPDAGLKMRCPKCATSFVVTKPGAPAAAAPKPGAPAAAAPKPGAPAAAAPKPGAPAPAAPAAKRPAPAVSTLPAGTRPGAAAPGNANDEDEWDLPAPAERTVPAGMPPPARRAAPPPPPDDDGDEVDLPIVAPRGGPPFPRPGAPPPKPAPAAAQPPPKPAARGFGEIDLLVDLPAPGPAEPRSPSGPAAFSPPEPEMDLPVARDTRAAAPRGAPPPVGRPVAPVAKAAATRGAAPPPAESRARTQLFGDTMPDPAAAPLPDAPAAPIRVPMPARDVRQSLPSDARQSLPRDAQPSASRKPAVAPTRLAAQPPQEPPPRPAETPGFGEIDLPLLAEGIDLPAPFTNSGLPVPAAGLPSPVEGGVLPAPQRAGLPVPAAGTTLPVATAGTSLPVRSLTPQHDRFERLSAPDLGHADGPAVHGPGHIAGADIYSGAAYDDRHMDPAFRTEARSVVTKLPVEEAEEAPLMTSSGQSVGARELQPSPPREVRTSEPRDLRTPEPRIMDAGASRNTQPGPRAPFASEPKLTRSSQPNIGDFIDRTSIELDLIEPTATPAPQIPVPQIPAPSTGISQTLAAVPDLATTPSGAMPPVGSRFDMDPFSENTSDGLGEDAGTEAPLADTGSGVGDEAELDGRGPGGRATTVPKIPSTTGPTTDAPPPRRPWGKYLLAAAVIGLFAGASMSLVPDIGPFGLNFVSDRLNAGLQNGALDKVREVVQIDLEADTSVGANTALGKVKTAQAAYPRHRATAGYAAFVAFSRGLRFGARPEDKAYGEMTVRVASTKPNDFFLLGQASQDAASGQIARARQTMQGLLERRPDDVDVAVLAGEVELLAKSGDQATKVWQRAVDIHKVARTLFGLARAQYAANDLIGAEASAKIALEKSPKHVGARALLAAIVWRNGGREQQALDLLSKVTEDGEIRQSAGEPELVAAYTQLGHIHLAKSRMTQAEVAFAAALKIDPQAVDALIGNGELFYRSGRFTEAIARYEAATRADADSVPAKIGMAKTMLFLERAKDAKDLLKALCETKQNEPLAFYWLGRAEEILGNKKEAEAAYSAAIKVGGDSPQSVDAYVALAQLLSSLGRAEDANARLADADKRFPGLAALHRARGEVALATGNLEEAKKQFETALAREDDIGTKFKLGSTLRRMRQFGDAAKLFDAIAESDKDFPGLALERGLLFEALDQSDRATEMYAKALQSAPNDLDLKLRVGSTQVMAGHAKQAEAILRDVYRAKPNSAEVNHFLGRALLVRGIGLAEAKKFLERAAEIDPNRAEYHLYVGWVANELGETSLAESALKRAIELDRNLGEAYWQRGVLLQKQGSALDALADLKIALEKSPSRFEIYATMAYCFQDQSRWPEAEEAWRKAIAGNDHVADWHFRLGKVFITRGNKALATPELDKAVALAEAPDKPSPGWLGEAHFLLGEAFRVTNRESAKRHYRRFLDLAPQNHPYRVDAESALKSLGP